MQHLTLPHITKGGDADLASGKYRENRDVYRNFQSGYSALK